MTSTDIQSRIDAGEPSIFIPPGIHPLADTLKTNGNAITFHGVYGHSILAPAVNDMRMLDINSAGACTFRDLFFHGMGRSGVTAATVGNETVSNSGSMVDHCAFIDLQRGIDGRSVDTIKAQNTRFICQSPTGATAVSIGNELEGDTWGGRIVDCDFIGPWENGIYDSGHGMIVRGCNFNGPVYQFNFEGWSRVVAVDDETVKLQSGPVFRQNWVGKVVQIEGKHCTVIAVISGIEMMVTGASDGINQRLYFATTGQLSVSECQFDSGEFNYCGIRMWGPNSFYGARVVNNRFSNWFRDIDHNACLIGMRGLSEFVFASNDCASGRDPAEAQSFGLNCIDCADATVTGNNFTNYRNAVVADRLLAANSTYTFAGNSFDKCLSQVKSGGGANLVFNPVPVVG